MSELPPVTRFAPSPTGRLHVGNARTALFNWLLARHAQGRMIIRIEDTDRERSRPEHEQAMLEDLRWFGLDWDEGPDRGGVHAPYRQSERAEVYARHFQELTERGLAYPCFCSPQALALSRKAQLAAGKPPRYDGSCARLSREDAARRIAAGEMPTLRFRVPEDAVIEFEDMVFGRQVFRGAEIGDFIIRRADGTPSFFFSNAVDDALMGVTHAFRGEDHLANTPRQIMLLEALGLRVPRYGHFPLVKDSDGGPLSKRLGSLGLADLRAQGYLPLAIANYLARLGHSFAEERFRDMRELAEDFDAARFGRAPAKYDAAQLLHWQKEAVGRLSDEAFDEWLAEHLQAYAGIAPERRCEFVAAIRDNVVLPQDAAAWMNALLEDALDLEAHRDELRAAGVSFFDAAREAVATAEDFSAFARAVAAATGAKGKALYLPLRLAFSGMPHGPEMARLWQLLGKERIERRLARAAQLAERQ